MSGLPNAFSRAMTSGKCSLCSYEAPGNDYSGNYIAIHFAQQHFGDLPWALVQAIWDHLLAEARTRTPELPPDMEMMRERLAEYALGIASEARRAGTEAAKTLRIRLDTAIGMCRKAGCQDGLLKEIERAAGWTREDHDL